MSIIIIVLAYFLGNISPAILLGKAKGIDIKKEGSGNAGTTNVLRVLGKKAAIITLAIDVLKGLIASTAGLYFFDLRIGCLCAAAVFLGHIYPIIFRFRGGKGAATAVGAILGLNWLIALIALVIAAIMLVISKRMSVGTLCAALAFPFLTLLLEPDMLLLSIFISLVVFIKHRGNIVRLFKGEEPKMSIFKDKEV